MILMALDHTLFFWSFGRVSNEGLPLLGKNLTFNSPSGASGMALTVMFLSSLCAPGFLFVAGYLQAISVKRREDGGESKREIRSHLLLRGISLVALQILAASPAFNLPDWRSGGMTFMATGVVFSLSVLSTIGLGLIVFALAGRLKPWQLLVMTLGVYLVAESRLPQLALSFSQLSWLTQGAFALLLQPVPFSATRLINNNFPLIPWLVPMSLGWVFGHSYQADKGLNLEGKKFLASGLASLVVFFILRTGGIGDYLHAGTSPVSFFFLSKYPPSPLYYLFYLGMLFVLFSLFIRLETAGFTFKILGEFGKVPLFFYIAHLWVYALLPALFAKFNQLPILGGALVWVLGLWVLYPLSHWYLKVRFSMKEAEALRSSIH